MGLRTAWRRRQLAVLRKQYREQPGYGQPYAYPTLSYPDQHSPDGVNPGYSAIQDYPGESNPNDQTLFETLLAFIDPALASGQTFDLLGGYSWGVANDSLDNDYGIGPGLIPFSAIGASTVTELQGALDRSGFNAWTVESVPLSTVIPEPGTAGLVSAFGVILWPRRGRRRRTPA
jgi:hypothetical protein